MPFLLHTVIMLRIYIATAWRNLWKKKFYTSVSILGLAVATAIFLLLTNYVRFERSYENFHRNAANIVRLTLDLYKGSEFVVTDCETYPPAGPSFKANMPEVLDYVRLQDLGESELVQGDKAMMVSKAYAADPSLFQVFDVKFLRGDGNSALNNSSTTVISETLARRLFGSIDVIGKSVLLGKQPFEVRGVIKDMPANTHLKFDFLVPFKTMEQWGEDPNSWNGNNNYTYLLLKPGTDLKIFNAKLRAFSQQRLKKEIITAEPISSIHLYSNKTFEPDVNGNARTVNFLNLIAMLITLIGAANFINLTTARAVERQKEAGLRRVLGSSRRSLMGLFFTESVIINFIAIGIALIFVKAAQPMYASLVGAEVNELLFTTRSFWAFAAGVFVLNTVLSGLYPAFVLSSVKARVTTTRSFTGTIKGTWLRKGLVVGQFAIALIVLSASVIVYQQLRFLKTQDLGMNIEQVLVLRGPHLDEGDSSQMRLGHVFHDQLRSIPGVQQVALAHSLPGLDLNSLNTRTSVRRYEETVSPGSNYYLYGVDEGFVPVLNMELLAGKNFSNNPAENNGKVLVNEEATRLLGFRTPETALNQRILIDGDASRFVTISGVLKNYHQQSLKEAPLPMIHWYSDNSTDYLALKVKAADVGKTLATIEREWKSSFPTHVFDYFFMDEMFNRQYKGDVQFQHIISVFAGFTLFITILGLLGLASYDASRRVKEIGVRKILGASPATILRLLSTDFLKLVLVAGIVAIPICWWVVDKWLQNYVYRVPISWWVFVGTGGVVLLISLMTIGFQSARAIMMNPAKTLRSE